jgi:GAF domain-containing protein
MTDPLARTLLQSVVDVARSIFGAAASSVFLLDESTDELVFEAVAGRGEGLLVGRRFPAGKGIAGWVVTTGEAMVVDDLGANAVFERAQAESTAYVPSSIMAAPLLHEDRILGVLEVLDASPRSRADLSELDLLALFAHQAAIALRITVEHRAAPVPDPRTAALDLVGNLQRLLLDAPVL